MHATSAARSRKAILPGRGVALLRAAEALKRVRTRTTTRDRRRYRAQGISPGRSPDRDQRGRGRLVIVGKILEKDQIQLRLRAQNGEYGNLVTKASLTRPRLFGRPWDAVRTDPGLIDREAAWSPEQPWSGQ